jgi:hypothetical protein
LRAQITGFSLKKRANHGEIVGDVTQYHNRPNRRTFAEVAQPSFCSTARALRSHDDRQRRGVVPFVEGLRRLGRACDAALSDARLPSQELLRDFHAPKVGGEFGKAFILRRKCSKARGNVRAGFRDRESRSLERVSARVAPHLPLERSTVLEAI